MTSAPTPQQDAGPPLVSLVVPFFNEQPFLAELFERFEALELELEILLVDDGSVDGSAELARSWASGRSRTEVISLATNTGKGAAVRAGIAASTGDILVIQDADLEYDPAQVPMLIAPIIAGHADVVFGSRLTGGQPQRAHLFWHYAGNRVLTLITRLLFNTTVSDMETGFKAFRGDLVRSLNLRSDDFQIEPELTAKVCRQGLRIYELPVAYYGRTYAEGKKITWRDGIKAVGALVKFRFVD